ncbi:MAG: hypothetical protein IJ008_00505 [Clostridia bacterium]|nr:hypothetical protein [Clostridia bacterium]
MLVLSQLSAAMSFNKLTTEIYIAFALSLAFTILSVAISLYYLRDSSRVNGKMQIIFTIIIPFMTCFLWTYTILDICLTSTLLSFFIALACIAVMFCLFFGIGKIKSKNTETEQPQKNLKKVKGVTSLPNEEVKRIEIDNSNNDQNLLN